MNPIRIVAETENTVTLRREDLRALMAELEDAQDRAAVAERRAHEAALGKDIARADYLTAEEVRRLLSGTHPVKLWREKRGVTQRDLAEAAKVGASYLAEIEVGDKPGSAATLAKLARALRVRIEDLLKEERRKDRRQRDLPRRRYGGMV